MKIMKRDIEKWADLVIKKYDKNKVGTKLGEKMK